MNNEEVEIMKKKLGKFLTINRIDDNVREEFINFSNEYFCGDFGMALMHIWREFKMYNLWKEDVSIKLNYIIDKIDNIKKDEEEPIPEDKFKEIKMLAGNVLKVPVNERG